MKDDIHMKLIFAIKRKIIQSYCYYENKEINCSIYMIYTLLFALGFFFG